MNDAEIVKALGQHLQGMADVPPIVWENSSPLPVRPYLVAQLVPTDNADPALNGGSEMATGYLMVIVVSKLNQFATAAQGIAGLVKARFPKALRITEGDTTVCVTRPGHTMQGYRDGGDWRTPVQIHYQAS